MTSTSVLVAVIGAPHGVRGEVRIKPYTEEPEALKDYSPLSAADGRVFKIKTLRMQKDMAIVRLDGIDTREAAERLTNIKLYVDRSRLTPPEDDETFFHSDLMGLKVTMEDGSLFGEIIAVPNFGAGDLLEVQPAAGGKTVYLPFTKAFVPTIDVAGGKVIITQGALGDASKAEDETP